MKRPSTRTNKYPLRLISLALCFALVLSLFGCSKPQEPAAEGGQLTPQQQLASIRRSSESDLDRFVYNAWGWGVQDGAIYTWGTAMGDAGPAEGTYALAWLDADGSCTAHRTFALPETPDPGANRMLWQNAGELLFAPDGGLWAVLETRTVSTRADGSYEPEDLTTPLEQTLQLCRVTEDGTLQPTAALELPQPLQGPAVPAVNTLTGFGYFADEDTLWLGLESGFACWLARFDAATGELQTALPLGEFVSAFARLSVNAALCFGPATQDGAPGLIRIEGLGVKSPIAAPLPLPLEQPDSVLPMAWPFVMSRPQAQPLLLTGETVWRLTEDGQAEAALQLADYGLAEQARAMTVQRLFQLEDDSLVVVTRQPGGRYEFHVLALDAERAEDTRRVLTLALAASPGQNMRRVYRVIDQFNYASDDIHIEIADYSSEGCDEAGYDSPLERLRWDLIHGTVPDIFVFSGNAFDHLALQRQGFFTDLYPYIDADPEMERADFLQNILQGCEYGETLPTVVTDYFIQTAIGCPAIMGEEPGWTWADYDALLAAYPQTQPFYATSFVPKLFMLFCIQWGGSRFVDMANGVCHLDSPEFIRLLEYNAAMDETPRELGAWTVEALQDGSMLTRTEWMNSFYSLRPLIYEFGDSGGFVFKGMPNDESNGSCILPEVQMAISGTCSDPDAAWGLVRLFLLPEYQDRSPANTYLSLGFPLRHDSLQKMAEESVQNITAPYGGLSPYYVEYDPDPEQVEFWRQGIPIEYSQQLIELIEATTLVEQREWGLSDILFEELDAMYAGIRTPEETAAILQDRISTYFAEQS